LKQRQQAPHPHVEGVVLQHVLQPQQPQVAAQRHLAHTVAVEVKLVLAEVAKVLGHAGVLLEGLAKCSCCQVSVTAAHLIPHVLHVVQVVQLQNKTQYSRQDSKHNVSCTPLDLLLELREKLNLT
jgi:hypothetical protein